MDIEPSLIVEADEKIVMHTQGFLSTSHLCKLINTLQIYEVHVIKVFKNFDILKHGLNL